MLLLPFCQWPPRREKEVVGKHAETAALLIVLHVHPDAERVSAWPRLLRNFFTS